MTSIANGDDAGYPEFNQLKTLESLTVALARSVLALQTELNPQNFDYVDITTNEDDKTITITWKDVPVDIQGNVVNYFSDDGFTSTSSDYPFNQSNRLAAAIEVFRFQHKLEIDTVYNNAEQPETKINYTLDSNSDIGSNPLTFSGSATLPISIVLNGGISQTEGKEYLDGSI